MTHTCPQCGDECLPGAVLCDGCWHELQPSRQLPPARSSTELTTLELHEALPGLDLPTCYRLAARGFRAV